ncbi:hypothetical protein ABUE34_12820 [Kozakia baliensis]|uniref:hypothetical protein n=1 Tax=Kozakia baliensis TaxID=153496 RepID=UPI00345BA2FE
MGQISMKISALPGSVLSENQHSPSVKVFEAVTQSQQTARQLYSLGGELRLNGVSRKYTFVNGILRMASQLPSGGRVLEARNFGIRWERIYPAGI